jgi:hypothetical protein
MSTASITPETITGIVSEALQKKLLHVRNPYHWLADKYGWGQRKAKAIVRGEYCPTSADLVALMASDDDVYVRVLEMIRRSEIPDDKVARIRAILEEQ